MNELQPLKYGTAQKELSSQILETAFPSMIMLVLCGLWAIIHMEQADFFAIKFCYFIICRFIYETEHHNGIAELLEILGRYVFVQYL